MSPPPQYGAVRPPAWGAFAFCRPGTGRDRPVSGGGWETPAGLCPAGGGAMHRAAVRTGASEKKRISATEHSRIRLLGGSSGGIPPAGGSGAGDSPPDHSMGIFTLPSRLLQQRRDALTTIRERGREPHPLFSMGICGFSSRLLQQRRDALTTIRERGREPHPLFSMGICGFSSRLLQRRRDALTLTRERGHWCPIPF